MGPLMPVAQGRGADGPSWLSRRGMPKWLGATLLGVPFVVALIALGSCGSDGEPVVEPSSAAAKSGEAVYANSCAACHGLDLEGTDKGPSHLSVVYEPGHHGDGAFRSAIANGAPQHHWNFGDMPPVEGLSAGQVDDVIAYIRGEQERRGLQN